MTPTHSVAEALPSTPAQTGPPTNVSAPRPVTPARCAPRRLRGGLAASRSVPSTAAASASLRDQWPHNSARARLAMATRIIRDIAPDPDLTWHTLPELLEEAVLTHAKDLARDGLFRGDVRIAASMAGHALQYWHPATFELTSGWVERTITASSGTGADVTRALAPTSLGRINAWGDRYRPERAVLFDLMHYTHYAGAVLDPWMRTKSSALLEATARVLPDAALLGIRILAPLASTALHMTPDGRTHPLGECAPCSFTAVRS